jgi:hypothetical protein
MARRLPRRLPGHVCEKRIFGGVVSHMKQEYALRRVQVGTDGPRRKRGRGRAFVTARRAAPPRHGPPNGRPGADGLGAVGIRCITCHQAENDPASGVPGHASWYLAPASMGWQGKTLRQICEQVQDPERNGGMDTAKLIHHMGEDTFVGWAWRSRADRMPAPGTQAEFGALVKAWLESGAHCPEQ